MGFSDIIDLWPSQAQMARDIGQDVELVYKWRQRNSIHVGYWRDITLAAKRREYPVTISTLLTAAEGEVA